MAVGPTVFAIMLWGSILGVAAVFAYEVSVVVREVGWR